MRQLSKDEAIEFAQSRLWEPMSLSQRARFQMQQDLLCMDFSVFHEAVEKTLDRPVWSHQFHTERDELKAALRALTNEEDEPTCPECGCDFLELKLSNEIEVSVRGGIITRDWKCIDCKYEFTTES